MIFLKKKVISGGQWPSLRLFLQNSANISGGLSPSLMFFFCYLVIISGAFNPPNNRGLFRRLLADAKSNSSNQTIGFPAIKDRRKRFDPNFLWLFVQKTAAMVCCKQISGVQKTAAKFFKKSENHLIFY
jgi:hypothetical protein